MSAAAMFHWLEVTADRIELHLPAFLRYDQVGDPASWVQHGIVCACVADVGQLLSWVMLHDGGPGLRLFGAGAFVYYLVREVLQAIAHAALDGWDEAIRVRRDRGLFLVGWGLDGLGDMIGPLTIALVAWL